MNTVINLLILAANLIVLGLTLKLYTEILKDASMSRRAATQAPKEAGK